MSDLLTFLDLQTRVLRWIDESTSTAATTTALVQDAINASHRRILTSYQWPFMAWPLKQSFTTSSGVSFYSLNPNADRVYHLWDTSLHQYVSVVPRREWPAVGVNRSNTATAPYGVALGPIWPVQVQPPTAGVCKVVSSSSSDTAGPTVILRGIDANGDIQTETLTANGTSIVTGAMSFTTLLNVTKTGTWVGTMTLSTGTTTLLSLLPSQYGRAYPTVEFLEDPESGRTFEYNFSRKPVSLANDHDIPEIPYPYSEMCVYDALIDLSTYNTELGIKEQTVWTDRFKSLKDGLYAAYDSEIVGAYPRMVRDLDDKGTWSRVAVYNP